MPGSPFTGSSFEIPRCVPLRGDPNERRCASTLLAAKTDAADEGVPADAPAAQEQGEREVCDPAAGAGQPQKRVALVHRLPDAPGSPVGIGFHAGIIA
jgi:hypothetical protein